jgi:hypothetical protein
MTPEQARQYEDCRYYDDAYLAWGVVGKVGAACATAATTSGAFVEGFADEEDAADWSLGLFITGGVCGLAALGGSWLSGEYAERHSQYCSDPEPTPFVREVEMPTPFVSLTPEEDAVTVEMPLVPEPAPALDVPLGETGTGSDGLADDEPLEPPGEEVP